MSLAIADFVSHFQKVHDAVEQANMTSDAKRSEAFIEVARRLDLGSPTGLKQWEKLFGAAAREAVSISTFVSDLVYKAKAAYIDLINGLDPDAPPSHDREIEYELRSVGFCIDNLLPYTLRMTDQSAVTPSERKILNGLAASSGLQTAAMISVNQFVNLSVPTVKKCVTSLIEKGFVHRPEGPRRGCCLKKYP